MWVLIKGLMGTETEMVLKSKGVLNPVRSSIVQRGTESRKKPHRSRGTKACKKPHRSKGYSS